MGRVRQFLSYRRKKQKIEVKPYIQSVRDSLEQFRIEFEENERDRAIFDAENAPIILQETERDEDDDFDAYTEDPEDIAVDILVNLFRGNA